MRILVWLGVLILMALLLKFWATAQDSARWDDCRSCHANKYEGSSKYMHPKETDCIGCHTSHDQGQENLLLGDEIILCQEPCHTNLGRSHPAGRGLRNPTSGQSQDVTCTSHCHDPHGSEFKAILRMNARDLCFSCHDL